MGDSGRLRQVVWNILFAAVKFTPQDGLITVTLTEEPREYVLEVIDNGRGIRPDFLPFIFQPFRQAGGLRPAARAVSASGRALHGT